jgi:predicted ATPase
MNNSVRLTELAISGFKTVRNLSKFEPKSLNILIGANGAGKSNFIAFFRLLSWMIGGGRLQEYIAAQGGASAILHDGSQKTREISAELTFQTGKGLNNYAFRLFFAARDTMAFADEKYRFSSAKFGSPAEWTYLGVGHQEARIIEVKTAEENKTVRVIRSLLRGIAVYQFHNTSETAYIRNKWDNKDSRYLKENGGNLAPFLLRLRENEPGCYRQIVDKTRLAVPFFDDFVLEEEYGRVLLQWREKGSEIIFNAFQASDGMLRTFCLVALLCQPIANIPDVLILDEPELGLHPFAINLISGMIKTVSKQKQVIIATQSAPLVSNFEPSDVVVVDRHGRESTFKRLDEKDLKDWLEDYTLGELWLKNILGGRPANG